MSSKKNDILQRVKHHESAIARGREYLASGAHAQWQGFHPLFTNKVRDGRTLPPHKDWVKNVFIPGHEKRLSKALKALENTDKNRKRILPRHARRPQAEKNLFRKIETE